MVIYINIAETADLLGSTYTTVVSVKRENIE